MRPRPTKKKTPAALTAGVPSVQTQPVKEGIEPMNSNSHPQNMLSLVIGDITIVQDAEGRYSLNDLHSAAGGAAKHAPGRWLRSQQAIELIQVLEAELTSQNDGLTSQIWPVKTAEGRYGGTYVVKELAIDYAAWISADFRLKVIRAYETMATTGKGHNLSTGMSVNSWSGLIGRSRGMLKDLAQCTDRGVAEGIYSLLLHTNRVNGIATLPLHRLAPGLRQELLDYEGDAA